MRKGGEGAEGGGLDVYAWRGKGEALGAGGEICVDGSGGDKVLGCAGDGCGALVWCGVRGCGGMERVQDNTREEGVSVCESREGEKQLVFEGLELSAGGLAARNGRGGKRGAPFHGGSGEEDDVDFFAGNEFRREPGIYGEEVRGIVL